jgi:transcriptional regulator with XRE-family HTH domain
MPFHPVDVHVGSRVKLRRTLQGISQQKLGNQLGITFQQIQKYEKGSNRIGASRLFELSQLLDVPPSFFFDDMPSDARIDASGLSEPTSEFIHPDNFDQYQMSRKETLELVRAYYKINDKATRKRVFELVKAIAGQPVEVAAQ